MSRKSLASSVIAAALLSAGVSHAEDVKQYADCTREATETDVTAAKGAFQAGNASFEEADYPRAIVYWEDAYRRDCSAHGMLLNLARAYELNGNKPQAVVALRTYLQRVPSADKEKIERRIEVLNRQIEAEKPKAAPTPVAPTPALEVPVPPPQTATYPILHVEKPPVAALVVAGAGGAITVLGTILLISGKAALADADEKCPDRNSCNFANVVADGNKARTRANLGTGLMIGGLAVAGGGLAWYFLSPRTKSSSGTQGFEPVVSTNYVGLNYASAF